MFTYELIEDGKVQIYRFNKPVKILKGVEAAKFGEKASKLNYQDAQIYLAKITGNYKFGNERMGKDHPRNKNP